MSSRVLLFTEKEKFDFNVIFRLIMQLLKGYRFKLCVLIRLLYQLPAYLYIHWFYKILKKSYAHIALSYIGLDKQQNFQFKIVIIFLRILFVHVLGAQKKHLIG